jgi:L-aspartate oxidase
VDVNGGWKRLRHEVSDALGIERQPEKLQALAEGLEDLALLPLSDDVGALELRSAAIIARLMARAACLRTESRGGHFRVDHTEPVPAWAGVRLRLARTGVDV